MSKNTAQLENVFRIYPEGGDGAFVEVYTDDDGMIAIKATTKESEVYFGKMNIAFEPQVAAQLVVAFEALVAQEENCK